MAGCGADTLANEISTSLLAGADFDLELPNFSGDEFKVPPVGADGIFADVHKLTNEDLTTKVVDGTGTFDFLMAGFKAHLKAEYEANRISGAEYTKAYIALTEGAMVNATSFLLGKDQSYWAAVNAQLQAQRAQVELVTARVQMESAKTQLHVLRFEAMSRQAEYALNKMRLSTESIQYCIAKYRLDEVMPQERALLLKQIDNQQAQTDLLSSQKQNIDNEIDLFPLKQSMLSEQVETQRAQTLNTRTDGTIIAGSMGKQQALYEQQIISYKRDAEMKAAKVFTDAWITMKTIDEGLLPPTGFQNTNLDTILTTIKNNNDL